MELADSEGVKLSLFCTEFNDLQIRRKNNEQFISKQILIFIIKGFQTIVFIFISTTFRPICPTAFFRCLSNSGTATELRTLLNPRRSPVLIPLVITVTYSCIISRLQSGLNLQSPYDFLLREPTPITVTQYAHLDNSEWIFGTYKLNVLTWLGLLLLCMIFFTCAHIQIFFLKINKLRLRNLDN